MGEDPLEAWPAWPGAARDDRDTIGYRHSKQTLSYQQINQSSDINKLVLFQINVKNE